MSADRLTLSVEEAANILGISRAFAYQLVAKKELPAVRLGRRIVVPRRAVEALVERWLTDELGRRDNSDQLLDTP